MSAAATLMPNSDTQATFIHVGERTNVAGSARFKRMIVAGDYGASGVFRISEQFVTARLPAEALIVTALACHIRGWKKLGLLLLLLLLLECRKWSWGVGMGASLRSKPFRLRRMLGP